MEIQTASQFLKENGLALPSFTALNPSVDNYHVLLFQPHGQIEVLYEKALPSGVRNKDRDFVEEWNDGKPTKWNNISGSAWYLKSLQLDLNDNTLCQNHQNGLYYTRLESLRAHALFFNYLPAVHLLVTSKVFHHGVEGSRSQRVGSKLTGSWIWNAGTKKLEASTGLTDGFDLIVVDCDDAKEAIKKLAKENPFNAERVLALCAGLLGRDEGWHRPNKLDSCQIDLSEEIKRITFAQDTKPNIKTFRTGRLKAADDCFKF